MSPKSPDLTPSAVLIETLSRSEHFGAETESEFISELQSHLLQANDTALGMWLVAFAGPDLARREALASAIGVAARGLAPDGETPANGAAAVAWQALLFAADHLHGSGAYALGRLPFLSQHLLSLLVDEAREQRPEQTEPDRRLTGRPGDILASLAVSRQLRETVSNTLGCAVVPTYDALYEYDPPGSYVPLHMDRSEYEIVVHLVVEHTVARSGVAESVLIAHRPGKSEPNRIRLGPGEAVVLRGRGTIHSWAPLASDEQRTLIAIGFEKANPLPE